METTANNTEAKSETACPLCSQYLAHSFKADKVLKAHVIQHRQQMVKGLKTLYEQNNVEVFYRAVKKAQKMLGINTTIDTIFNAAFTLRSGPTYLNDDQLDTQGRLTPETKNLPHVQNALNRAHNIIQAHLPQLQTQIDKFAQYP